MGPRLPPRRLQWAMGRLLRPVMRTPGDMANEREAKLLKGARTLPAKRAPHLHVFLFRLRGAEA